MSDYESSFKQLMELKNITIKDLLGSFIKHLTSVSVILVPLLSFLHLDQAGGGELFHYLLISLLACILSGVANLYIVLVQHRTMADGLIEELKKSILEQRKPKGVPSKYNTALDVSELLCLLSFLASVILIVCLAW